MTCDPKAIATDAYCLLCIPAGRQMSVKTALLCAWAAAVGPATGNIYLLDANSVKWRVAVSVSGNLSGSKTL